ncbi:hypothetical protein E2C01_007532 [Portunus trituberculatus]|uniref:Uncharacterized protein n=1 Tax=Portunus trituberculatus TaxID=210409 RepID=A0A5B7CZ99_PORTR|nr:hypothetical protein [Portunus trituberculatus]
MVSHYLGCDHHRERESGGHSAKLPISPREIHDSLACHQLVLRIIHGAIKVTFLILSHIFGYN